MYVFFLQFWKSNFSSNTQKKFQLHANILQLLNIVYSESQNFHRFLSYTDFNIINGKAQNFSSIARFCTLIMLGKGIQTLNLGSTNKD